MSIDYPLQSQVDELRTLWREAFKDSADFLDNFYTYGFAPDRCRCVTVGGKVAAALYWFDCTLNGRPIAYLYGVATAKAYRGKGHCRALLENTHAHLKYLGYSGAILVPGDEKLFRMYEEMGYSNSTGISEFTCEAGAEPVAIERVDAAEYCRLRREYLPENGVVQEGDGIEFLLTMADFYAGDDFVAVVARDGKTFVPEFLGNVRSAPGLLAALHRSKARIRVPGQGRAFSMYHPLDDQPAPGYFGLAFD